MQNFQALGAPPPDPRASGGWGLCPQTPKTAPPLRISGYAPGHSTKFAIGGRGCFGGVKQIKRFLLGIGTILCPKLGVDPPKKIL